MRATLARLDLRLGCFFGVRNAFNRASLKSSELKMTGVDPQIA
jgi:hypothetical protein